ncbi:DNA replication complex GINS protein [Wickerhamomyces ciferrii]|uniref:DNA replication complex GINS protein PSF3 n=1 Tax=Wickerhamomyces ciferrii (strain ATCC 14091 / BCRC 22168 / CBS 111 / JCM 3599 / NBRC 0793 / NRRL Y-1031 F-60-10) TaxID=1206466 RepID=K0KDW1_WICCF|nr:DNA replication complex GINS protein [Wickerhamomyces ciferrii]CCH43265.1 DNA replication complex GINS protein [Wickerhamomyces ciferrii]
MSYYDLDDIISDGQVSCSLIAKDTKLELPIWIAEILAICSVSDDSSSFFIEMIQPEAIGSKVMNAIKTSPTSIDIHSISQHYYSLVEKWGKLYTDKKLVDVVQQMLKERSEEINNHAQSLRGAQQETSFLYTLDEFEKQLYKISHESHKNLKKWLQNESS